MPLICFWVLQQHWLKAKPKPFFNELLSEKGWLSLQEHHGSLICQLCEGMRWGNATFSPNLWGCSLRPHKPASQESIRRQGCGLFSLCRHRSGRAVLMWAPATVQQHLRRYTCDVYSPSHSKSTSSIRLLSQCIHPHPCLVPTRMEGKDEKLRVWALLTHVELHNQGNWQGGRHNLRWPRFSVSLNLRHLPGSRE